MNEIDIKKFILRELGKFNFKTYTKGFKYLKEAIYICIIDEDAIENLSKNVFPQIAIKYNEKTYFNVKWCIEQVIKTMYYNTDIELLINYFNIQENIRPSLKLIIYTIVCNYQWKHYS